MARRAVEEPRLPSSLHVSSVRSYERWRIATGSGSLRDPGRGARIAAGVRNDEDEADDAGAGGGSGGYRRESSCEQKCMSRRENIAELP